MALKMIVPRSQSVRTKGNREVMLGATTREGTPRAGMTKARTTREVTLEVTTLAPILTVKEMEEILPGATILIPMAALMGAKTGATM